MPVQLSAAEIGTFLEEVFPQVDGDFIIEKVAENAARVRLVTADKHLRPGGTISGPSMFALADVAAYIVTLAMIGREALAVTTNCSIDFMRKPAAGKDLIAEATLLKLGRQLAVTDVRIRSDGSDQLVARAGLTYALPPRPAGDAVKA
ncbi:PaaI family thioesterase [Roseobacter ponti]|uniref:PaaI family thioesterase n=1 Tax=Roseobacter ponti TaxID=1891787 RepID=A0A858SWU6_9RHOB|nr:PaaI family thioesterase [Roseobacter ponti]QJF51346.1 PaaI family thioesterase [Roseobacter ponti]